MHLITIELLNHLWMSGFVPLLQEVVTMVNKKQDKQEIVTKTISPADWQTANGETYCDLETSYPAAKYDLAVEIDGDRATEVQMAAWSAARPVGSPTKNRIVLKGVKPNTAIQTMLKVVKK